MSQKELSRYDIIKSLINEGIDESEASKQISLSVRQVKRLKKRVEENGHEGLAHKNRGRKSNRGIKEKVLKKLEEHLKEKYADFKPSFACEKLEEKHNIKIGRETTRQLMIKLGLWKPKHRKMPKNIHLWRLRKDNFGEMQQFDGSYHLWLEDRAGELCLLLSVDDATGKISHAKFDYNEGVEAVFKFWLEYFKKNGFPLSIYLDKFSTYKVNHKNAVDNKDMITQFERAMREVGVKPITAHSPQAKGRVERMFGTLQDRMVKEMRLLDISTIDEANEFLKEYIPKFNAKFAVVPSKKADLHKQPSKAMKAKLNQIFSIHSKRKVNNDYTVMFKNQYLQLDAVQATTVYKKDTVIIEEHLNGEIKISFKGHHLNYKVLPQRPKKEIEVKLPALTRKKQSYIPHSEHPWRKQLVFKNSLKKEKVETIKN